MTRERKCDAAWLLVTALTMLLAGVWRTDIPKDQLLVIVPVILIGGTLAALGLLMGIRRAAKGGWKPEQIFLLLFIPLSLGMMAVMPVWRAPDEPAHLQRIWQISTGHWFPDEQTNGVFYEPANMMGGIRDYREMKLYNVVDQLDVELEVDNLVPSGVGANTGIYPVSNYFPQALGMALMRLVTNGKMAIFYAARLGAWAVTLLLFYYAVRQMPVGQYAMIALTLLPMMLQEAASASADGMTCAAAMALTAFVARACLHPARFSRRQTVWLAVLMALVATLKMMYCPLILLTFAIPASCFGGKRRKNVMLIVIAAAVLAAAVGWMLFCNAKYVGAGTGRGDGMREQLTWMLANPGAFMAAMGRTVYFRVGSWIEQIIGKDLSWYNVQMPSLIFWAFVLSGVQIIRQDHAEGALQMRALGKLGAALCAACLVIVLLSLYIWETPCGNESVLGIQGRYFIPLLPALYMALKKNSGEGDRLETLKRIALLDIWTLGFVLIYTIV